MGLGKFLVCSELFYHYTNTRYVSFLSSLLPLDLTGGLCAVSSSGLNGLGKFLVCSELFYHYTNTRYVSFLSSLLPLDLTGRSCAVSSPLSAWPARGRDGYCKVYHFCTIQPASLTLTHTHSLTHSLYLLLIALLC